MGEPVSEHCPTCGTNLASSRPVTRRLSCEGGCGAWWYQTGPGRNRRFCDRCYAKHRKALRSGLAVPVHESDEFKRGAA